jgi:hypothetical protein
MNPRFLFSILSAPIRKIKEVGSRPSSEVGKEFTTGFPPSAFHFKNIG